MRGNSVHVTNCPAKRPAVAGPTPRTYFWRLSPCSPGASWGCSAQRDADAAAKPAELHSRQADQERAEAQMSATGPAELAPCHAERLLNERPGDQPGDRGPVLHGGRREERVRRPRHDGGCPEHAAACCSLASQIPRADMTPSIARSSARTWGSISPSTSTSVTASSPRDLFSRLAMFCPC